MLPWTPKKFLNHYMELLCNFIIPRNLYVYHVKLVISAWYLYGYLLNIIYLLY
jgi:hypothetical protein